MAHQYKVGDKVRIIERKGVASDYPCFFNESMAQQKDKIFTIEKIGELSLCSSNYTNHRFYNGDAHFYSFKEIGYLWHSSMFEPAIVDLKVEKM